MSKVKILHCYKTYYPVTFGGIEQVIFQLSESMVHEKFESVVFSVNNNEESDEEVYCNHHVVKVKKDFEVASTPFSLSAIKKFKKLAEKADVIHYHFPYPFMDLLHFIAKVKKPTVLSYHSDIIKQKKLMSVYRPLMNLFLNKIDRIVCASPNYLRSSEVLENFKDKVSVVPYGIPDIALCQTDKKTDDVIKERFPSGYFLFVGSFRYYKGLHYLLEAMKGCDIPVILFGANGEEVNLKNITYRNNIQNIHFVGAECDSVKYSYLSKARGFVFPSHLRSEAFGISLVEAACFSLPMISCEIGTGTTFINVDGVTGLVVDGANPLQLKEAIKDIWLNEEKSTLFGINARKRYEELFTSEIMAKKYSIIYKEVIAKYQSQ